jgi:thiol-disulfide isomerase/thioredoxin
VARDIDVDRRRLLGRAAMTFAAARFVTPDTLFAKDNAPRELAAIADATEWINSPRLTTGDLQGKVVLVDFWTYTCINWLRTLPYIRAWAKKYAQGLVVVGVHTPEFPFEHDVENVRREVRRREIDYPVAIDSSFAIWRAFKNQYWPALYLLDAKAKIRQHQFGEGEYPQTEMAIQRLLADAGAAAAGDAVAARVEAGGVEAPADWASLRTPETYVGYERAERFASRETAESDRRRRYTAPARLDLNQWALAGEWTIGKQATVLNSADGRIVFRFHARDLHLVMGPPRSRMPIRFRVSLDGQPPGAAHGLDVDEAGNGTVTEPRLYQLIRQRMPIVDRQFEIAFPDAGVETYSFTFG